MLCSHFVKLNKAGLASGRRRRKNIYLQSRRKTDKEHIAAKRCAQKQKDLIY
jgi:hypothetical protein